MKQEKLEGLTILADIAHARMYHAMRGADQTTSKDGQT